MQISRRTFLAASTAALSAQQNVARQVVLTFDDAVKSHVRFVAPFLKELGFRATFFISHRWMPDAEHFLTWKEVAEIHGMGFEIGNHTWTHDNFAVPRNAARLDGELALVENELAKVGVPKPVSFAWTGNCFGPEALEILERRGYRFARRGISPEKPYGTLSVGPAYDPARYDRMMIPSTGDGYPDWTFEHFLKVIAEARPGRVVVLQFHGVPDEVHPWVHTPPAMFRRYMEHLSHEGFKTMALGDVESVARSVPGDPLRKQRFPEPKDGKLILPVEMQANRDDDSYWLANMQHHGYNAAEVQRAFGQPMPIPRLRQSQQPLLPYPGTRHPRADFLDGAVDPFRGTKLSLFLPTGGYAVIDLPEAIFSNLGLTFLAHTHVPTIWNADNVIIDNVDWRREPNGALRSQWKLPNGIEFGATADYRDGLDMTLWLKNGTTQPLTGLRTQICVLLKEAKGYAAATNDNKRFGKQAAAVESAAGGQWLIAKWERAGRTWGNARCPCFHADPVLPDCPPGETVRVKGRLWMASNLEGFE
jgi:peptidoglycan/xylan/chitin deacetylase (PgdA/CDA1 family)